MGRRPMTGKAFKVVLALDGMPRWAAAPADADPAALLAAGATLLREPGGDLEWWVLADPEGNEFCAFAP